MRVSGRPLFAAAFAALLAAPLATDAQQPAGEYTNNFKYNSGQSVQPVFEGWSRAADGTFNMHFGYLNRNWAEEPHVPVGADNQIQPGGPDRGQPTYFYTRTQRNLFIVNVPRDWGRTRELTWTVTVNGRTERAVAWLQPEWEIDPVGGAAQGGNTDEEYVRNQPPSLSIAPVASIALSQPAALSVTVTDDGLPVVRPRGKPAVGQETPPTLQGGTDAPVNVPTLAPRSAAPGGRPQGPTVTWIVWRGPADASFQPRVVAVEDGKAESTVRFTRPGTYVLRATASDTSKVSHASVSVAVRP
jgi:hypothetical protein